MLNFTSCSKSCKAVASLVGIFAALLLGGCATQRVTGLSGSEVSEPLSLGLSPVAEPATPREAWRRAEDYARVHPGCEVLVGSGDSMLPFYRDKTVLVVAHLPMNELRVGMTVIFLGESQLPVAHLLMEKTSHGWRTRGVGNDDDDRTRVRYDNYIGTVIKAYDPAGSLALSEQLASPPRVAMLQPTRQ